jgi:HK97 family phage major capsid protein
MKLSPESREEIFTLSKRATDILSRSVVTIGDRKKVDLLLAQMASIRDTGFGQTEAAHRDIFKKYLRGQNFESLEAEIRSNDFLAGNATVSYTDGTKGGFLVPQSFQKSVTEGLAAVDPLLDPKVANVIFSPDFRLQPLQLPGWDLSTIAAVQVAEAAHHNSDVTPGVEQKLLNKFTYRVSLSASLEWEEDQAAFNSAMAVFGRAFGIGFARGIGADLVNGNGSTAPQGVLTGAANSGVTTAGAGVLALSDFTDIYFSVNKLYRESEKRAWLMSDATYKKVRNAKDSSNRPLFPLTDDKLVILGKPVYVCPSLPSAAGSKGIVFGDLSHFNVHATTLFLRRKTQVPGYVEYGKALYVGLMSVDAVLFDPTSGSLPPVVYATLHA